MDSASEKSSFKLNNFEVQLHFNNTQLVVQAEHIPTSKRFQVTITDEHVKEMTNLVFLDVEFLYLGLLDAAEGKDPNATVSLDDDAKLTYSSKKMVRDKTRTEQFTLGLGEEKIDDMARLNKQFEMLIKKVEQQEQRIEALEKENRRLKSDAEKALLEGVEVIEHGPQVKEEVAKEAKKIETKLKEAITKGFVDCEKSISLKVESKFIERLQQLEKELLERPVAQIKVDYDYFNKKTERLAEVEEALKFKGAGISECWEFDAACKNAHFYNFSHDNKTIEYKSSGAWKAIFAKNMLPRSQKSKVSVRTDLTKDGAVMIGICRSSYKDKDSINKKGVYCYNGWSKGCIYADDQCIELNNGNLTTGSTVTVIVDLSNNSIAFDINDKQIYTGSVIGSYEYYPFVQTYDTSDKVTFI